MVTDIRPDSVVAAGWTIPTQNVVWAAGNIASPLTRTLGVPLDQSGPGHRRARLHRSRDTPRSSSWAMRPPFATVKRSARFRASARSRSRWASTLPDDSPEIATGARGTPFTYWDKGQLAVIGRGHAVADIWSASVSAGSWRG